MERQNRKTPSLDDIMFEFRNREYGAYQLRKRYNYAVNAGILISIFIGCVTVIIPSLNYRNNDMIIAGGGRYVQAEMENLPAPDEMIYVAPPPPPPEKTGVREAVKYVAPVIVDSIFQFDQKPVTTDEALIMDPETEEEVSSNGVGDEDLLTGEGTTGEGDVFFLVEQMPTFKGGGLERFREWINKRTNYPQAAIDGKIMGTVYLTFVVEKDGSVSNVEVLKGVHPLLDNEAIKAISESPKWTPGLQRGRPVRIRYQIPLHFQL